MQGDAMIYLEQEECFMGSTLEIILTVIAMSFWVLFPIGMFLSVSRLDKNTDQIVRLENLRPSSTGEQPDRYRIERFDWHHPIIYFRRWLQHD